MIECFTKVWIFSKRCFKCFWEFVWKCCGLWFLKRRQVFLQVWSQVTKSFVYPIVLKGFCHVLTPFNNFVLPLKLVDNLAFRKFIRDGRGSSYGPWMQWCQVSLAICFEGAMIIPFRQHFEGLMIIWFCFAKDTRRASMAHFGRQQAGLLWGCKCDCVLISCICLVLGYLAFDFMYIQTLGLTMVYLKNCKLRNVNLRYYKIMSGSGDINVQGDETYSTQ